LKLLVGQLEKLEFGLRELRRTADVEVHERVDLRAWTALGVGGVASLVARCYSENGVCDALDLTASHGFGWVVLGGGSRLITPDGGVRVPLLSLTGELARWQMEADGLVAGSGANMAQVCRAAARVGLSGIEHLGTEQHSVGGLVAASATGIANLKGLLDWIELQRPGDTAERWTASNAQPVPDPRDLRRRVVTRVRFRLRPSAVTELPASGGKPVVRRALRSTGPVFLDSEDASAGDLLSEVGFSNASAGGVRFGGERGNELLAGRSAYSVDVLDLCRRARDRVLAATGVYLISALVFIDEDGREIEL